MPPIGENAIARIRRDHAHMLQLTERIRAECTEQEVRDSCKDCAPVRRVVCRGNVEQLIRSLVETTLKHNLIESMFMEELVPAAHRLAHNQAHMAIARQLQAIRVVFAEDGNGIVAIEGIEQVHQSLLAHFREYDEQLEIHLAAAAPAPPS